LKQEILVGQTDYTVLVLIRTTAGAPATALTEASVDIAYARVETDNDVTTTDVTPAALAALTTAHTDWGLEEVSATDHPGLYRLDIADAVFASGAWSAVVSVVGTGLDPCQIEFILVNHSPFSAVADILTDTGTTLQGELDAIEADVDAILVDTNEVQISLAAGGLIESMVDDLQTEVDGIQADTEDIQARLPAALVGGRIDATVDGTGLEAGAAAVIADAVWDEAIAGHAGAGSTGEALSDAGAAGTPPTVIEIRQEMDANSTQLAAIVADTNEVQISLAAGGLIESLVDDIPAILADTNELQTDWVDGGRLDLILDARASQTSVNTVDDLLDTELPALTTAVADLPTNAELATALGTADDAVLAAIAALNNLSAAQVATEVADALGTDTYAEPTGVPAATAALATKLGYVFMALRNRIDVTTTKKTFYDDGGAAEWEKDLSDDGTTYQESEGNAI